MAPLYHRTQEALLGWNRVIVIEAIFTVYTRLFTSSYSEWRLEVRQGTLREGLSAEVGTRPQAAAISSRPVSNGYPG
jgi:hypothetical protein